MIGVTRATDNSGRPVIDELLRTTEASQIVDLAQYLAEATRLTGRGVVVRLGNYNAVETLVPALDGVTRLLLMPAADLSADRPRRGKKWCRRHLKRCVIDEASSSWQTRDASDAMCMRHSRHSAT